MVEATRTVRIPLIVPADRRDDLHQTRPKYQHCQNKTVEYCWPTTPKQPDDLITNKGDAEAALYDQLREETDGLHANLVQKAISLLAELIVEGGLGIAFVRDEIVGLRRCVRPAILDGFVLAVLVLRAGLVGVVPPVGGNDERDANRPRGLHHMLNRTVGWHLIVSDEGVRTAALHGKITEANALPPRAEAVGFRAVTTVTPAARPGG